MSAPPLSKNGLAVFPLQVVGPREPEAGLTHGLLTMLLPALRDHSTSFHVDPFSMPITAQIYGEVQGHDPEAFARWSGAGAILTGTLSDLGDRRVRVVLRRLNTTGDVVWMSKPVVGQLDAAGDLYRNLLVAAGQGLDITIPGGFCGGCIATRPFTLR